MVITGRSRSRKPRIRSMPSRVARMKSHPSPPWGYSAGTCSTMKLSPVPVEWRLAMETWELEAREVLDDLLATYYKLGDSGRIPEQAGLFEPDGVVELYGRGEFVGREAIINAYRGLNDNHVAEPDVTY